MYANLNAILRSVVDKTVNTWKTFAFRVDFRRRKYNRGDEFKVACKRKSWTSLKSYFLNFYLGKLRLPCASNNNMLWTASSFSFWAYFLNRGYARAYHELLQRQG